MREWRWKLWGEIPQQITHSATALALKNPRLTEHQKLNRIKKRELKDSLWPLNAFSGLLLCPKCIWGYPLPKDPPLTNGKQIISPTNSITTAASAAEVGHGGTYQGQLKAIKISALSFSSNLSTGVCSFGWLQWRQFKFIPRVGTNDGGARGRERGAEAWAPRRGV